MATARLMAREIPLLSQRERRRQLLKERPLALWRSCRMNLRQEPSPERSVRAIFFMARFAAHDGAGGFAGRGCLPDRAAGFSRVSVGWQGFFYPWHFLYGFIFYFCLSLRRNPAGTKSTQFTRRLCISQGWSPMVPEHFPAGVRSFLSFIMDSYIIHQDKERFHWQSRKKIRWFQRRRRP